jgi:low temperature requirement protein LtrA
VSRLRTLTPRAEKTIRLVASCAVASVLGITAVVIDSEPLAYAAVGIVLAGILAGPLVARLMAPPDDR